MSAASEQLMDLWLRGRSWFLQREPRERTILSVGGVCVLLAMIYAALFAPLHHAINSRAERLDKKRDDLAWMQSVMPQVAAFNSQPGLRNSSGESMVVLVANSASTSHISQALTGQTPDGPNGVRVRFEGVSFDALVVWLGVLQKEYGIRTTAADINRTAQPGVVTAALSLQRAGA